MNELYKFSRVGVEVGVESESNGNNFYLYSHFMISTRDEVFYSSGLFGKFKKTIINI